MTQQTQWQAAASLETVRAGAPLEVALDAGTILLVVAGTGEVKAFEALCPHDHARLCDGWVEDGALVCPRHRARFQLEDGVPQPGFRLRALTSYPCRVVAEQVEVDVDAVRRAQSRRRWDFTSSS